MTGFQAPGLNGTAVGSDLRGSSTGPVSTDPLSDLELAGMPAPSSVPTLLWTFSSPSERRELLAQAEATPEVVATFTPVAEPAPRLGNLSMVYETGHQPGEEGAAAATISSGQLNGRPDPGGRSYGAYQLTSSADGGRQVQVFLRNEGARWAAEFGNSDPAAAGAFGTTWRQIAAREPDAFFQAQHDYIERTHYQPVVDRVADREGFDIGSRSAAVRDVIWSMSVQHGRAAMLVQQAVQRTDATLPRTDAGYDRALVNALYDGRENYARANGFSDLIESRYVPERRQALEMLDADR